MKKRILIPALLLLVLLCGCAGTANTQNAASGIVCTTQQLANLTERVLDGTTAGESTPVACVVTEPVSCLHDYTLSVRQMQLLENAAVVIESGMGLEDFMEDALRASHCTRITASTGVTALPSDEDPDEPDPHIWLAPENCAQMAQTIADGLAELSPEDAARGFAAGMIDEGALNAVRRAWESRVRPPWGTALGGEIYLHEGGAASDWTRGCIALEKADMALLFEHRQEIAAVHILP